MDSSLPDSLLVKILQAPGALSVAQLRRIEHLLVLTPEDPPETVWKALPAGETLARLSARHTDRGQVPLATARLDNAVRTGITVAAVRASASRFQQLEQARKLVLHGLAENPSSVAMAVSGFEEAQHDALVECLLLSVQAAAFRLPRYARRPTTRRRLRDVHLLGAPRRLRLDRVAAVAAGNNLARWLTAMPTNRLHAGEYRRAVRQLADEYGWSMRFLDEKELARAGAGAFLAVSQANAKRDAGIIHLRHRPNGAARPTLALAGKGILFDTGGTNLKGFQSMLDMHMDKGGAGTALGTLVALTRMGADYPIDCWLAVTENRIGPRAYKPQDVVTASNGTTIQVVHTDAEGRMVLADTLALAARERPSVIIDYATLTGSCVTALTDRYSGVFTNRPQLHPLLIQTGNDCGERVWPFPMDEDYDELLKSDTADIRQCAAAGQGDHILGARFLSRFVPDDSCWIHMDLAAGMREHGLGFVATKATGFGVLYTVSLLSAQTSGPAELSHVAA